MKDSYIKLFIGVVLFATWVTLVLLKTPGTEDLISAIKLALLGLGAYHLDNNYPTTPTITGTAELIQLPKPAEVKPVPPIESQP